ncbi:MAG: DUF4136 domain-containing protein [Bryobacteraceae bacterium]
MRLAALAVLFALSIGAEEFAPFDLAQARTFQIRDVTAKSKTREVSADRLIPVVRERIAARLRSLGLRETDGNGDVRVTASLHVDSDHRPASRSRPSHRYDYRGRLLITVRAGAENALVWQKFPSFSEDEADRFEDRLGRHVDRALKAFPPKSK